MFVKKVRLRNFLSYTEAECEFFDGLCIVCGENAAGKTNLIESIYFSAVGKSARNLKDRELINWDAPEPSASMKILVEKRYSRHVIDISIDRQGKKRILIDGIPITRTGELMGVLNIVYFSPNEMRLVKESPADRRRFLDISLSQQDKLYFYTLMRYNKLLAQRNKLLKSYKSSPDLKSLSDLVVAKLIECQELIIKKRREFLERLAPLASARHSKITQGREELDLSYEGERIENDDIATSLKRIYEESFDKDCRLEYTTAGAHRDDIKITADGVDIRKFGSQGQQRTAVLSLKLAEAEMFFLSKKERPVLILDDVLSELDADRQRALFEGIKDMQTIITCTEFEESLAQGYTKYLVKQRKIQRV